MEIVDAVWTVNGDVAEFVVANDNAGKVGGVTVEMAC